ncbi:MAG: 4-phosphopantetheinyl transferase family protein [Polaribacter sp.]|nr:4-phosphopantetheinyl transferase family protein [Polaribacter sp.]
MYQNEQAIILNSKNQFQKVWLLWSMKEAAYKCYTQQFQQRFFAPQKFECELKSKNLGKVSIDKYQFQTKSTITKKYIHTIAVSNFYQKYTAKCFDIIDSQNASNKINNKIQDNFAFITSIKKDDIGVPYLYSNNQKTNISLSKSHHGKFGAFALKCDF